MSEKAKGQKLRAVLLAVRLFLAWWVLPTVALVLLPGGGELAALLGVLVLPAVAIGVAVYGARVQSRAVAAISPSAKLGASHDAVIQLPMPAVDAEGALAGILQDDLGATKVRAGGHAVRALFGPPEWSGWLRRTVSSDEVVATVEPAGDGGATVEVLARPVNRLLHATFWFDRGRNLRRLRRLQEHLGERVAAEGRRREAATRAASLEARLSQAELLLLRAQVEPHFLFNTLAHLREIVRSGDQAAALSTLDHLVAHARAASSRIGLSTLPLAQELESVRGFLSLTQVRFGERLRFSVNAEDAALPCEVPVGALLIPVENAVKHGIEPRQAPGTVEVSCRRREDALELEVLDDGPGLPKDPASRGGTGLANLRERLALQFPLAARLSVEDRETGGVRVLVSLPAVRPVPVPPGA